MIDTHLESVSKLFDESYNPHKSMIDTHLESVNKLFDVFYKRYENFIFMGDFNSEMCEEPTALFIISKI